MSLKKDQIFGPVVIKYTKETLFGYHKNTGSLKSLEVAFVPAYITQRAWVYLLLSLLEDAKGIITACRSKFYKGITLNDYITYKGIVTDTWEKSGRYYFNFSYTAINQKDEIVAEHELTAIALQETLKGN